MKTNKLIFMSMMALATMLSACSNEDEEVAGNGNGNGGNTPATAVFTASAPGDGAAANSRIAMEENDPTNKNAGLKSTWQAKDKFVVVNLTKSDTIDFTTGTIDAAATYTTMVPSYTTNKMDSWATGDQLCAYYYGNDIKTTPVISVGTDGSVSVNMNRGQDGTLATLAKYTLLYSNTITFNKTGTNNFDFYHAMSYLRVKVHIDPTKNPANTTISKILITNPDGTDFLANGKATAANVATGNWSKNSNAAPLTIPLASTNRTIDSNGDLFVYLAVFPQTLSDGFTMTAVSGEKANIGGYNSFGYAAGIGSSIPLSKGKIRSVGGTWKSAYEWIDETFFAWDTSDSKGAMTARDADKNLTNGFTWTTLGCYNRNTSVGSYASRQCKNSPTTMQMRGVFSSGVYWDDGTHGNPQSYEAFRVHSDGITSVFYILHEGAWLNVNHTSNAVGLTEITSSSFASYYHYGSKANESGWVFFPAYGYYRSAANALNETGYTVQFWTKGKNTDIIPTSPALDISSNSNYTWTVYINNSTYASFVGQNINGGYQVYNYW